VHAFVANLTAALLLLHAALGCCWHQAPACDDGARIAAATAEPCSCPHEGQHEHDSGEPTPCPCQIDCAGPCQSLLTRKVTLDAPAAPIFAVLAMSAAAVEPPVERVPVEFRSPHGPPLRAHLQFQLLLI
jgi:hypothetical protein